MFDRIKRSFDLVRASAQVLRQDKHLLLFPIISAVAMLLVLAAFALPLFGMASFDGVGKGGVYSLAFLFYVVQYFVIFYFNTALVGAVMIRLDGGAPTLGDGLRIANGRFGTILGYAVIAATVGVILRALQERLGFVGRLVVGLVGAGWAVATFLVVPVIVTRDHGTLDAISESTSLVKRTWGENLVGQTGLSAAFGLVYFLLIAAAVGVALLLAPVAGSIAPVLMVAFATVVVLASLACILFHATLSGIYSAVVYRYAAGGNGTPGFDAGMLASSFRQKS
ncbi:hypothetical protein HH212_24470 [Massilia forsythiae]|uniref:Glycerophosphoryl diester phosphodiesterase membrane domain-containing protein n=1 Tax=Massilia forsythiae TaxID=2728020 RepID=A0A7Z2ZUT8_9BURK|nr:DUF6159 family protein [Massilia forsythiae]QJE02769.1 hypothetical protein HH212_24470 [Massilia forsythiae]